MNSMMIIAKNVSGVKSLGKTSLSRSSSSAVTRIEDKD